MMETSEMIYTAIFQDRSGAITRARFTGVINKQEAWASCAALGESNGACLVALVPGDHPVYTYEEVFQREPNMELKQHDVFEVQVEPDENVYEMT